MIHGHASEDASSADQAREDARKMQTLVSKQCNDAGQPSPPYQLLELIGKGSFGRVYKAARESSGTLVAVKIMSIDESDSIEPGAIDTVSEVLQEVNALKLLSESGAKNINSVIDTLLVDQSVWMVTQYCAGGSVATLKRPTGFLAEKWIIPILREVAEALFWIHNQGIIHRDIK